MMNIIINPEAARLATGDYGTICASGHCVTFSDTGYLPDDDTPPSVLEAILDQAKLLGWLNNG